jgi:hypothetical protein
VRSGSKYGDNYYRTPVITKWMVRQRELREVNFPKLFKSSVVNLKYHHIQQSGSLHFPAGCIYVFYIIFTTNETTMYIRNDEARSHKRCYRGKERNTTYSGWVSVALFI